MTKSEYEKLLADKKEEKTQLYHEKYGNISTQTPLLLLFAPHPKNKELYEHFWQLLEGLSVLSCHTVVIAQGKSTRKLPSTSRLMVWLDQGSLTKKQQAMYEIAADMAVLFEDDNEAVTRLMERGVVVLGNERLPMLENYQPNDETGNSFTFRSSTSWDIFRALVRAHETYLFPYDWGHIVRGILKGEREMAELSSAVV